MAEVGPAHARGWLGLVLCTGGRPEGLHDAPATGPESLGDDRQSDEAPTHAVTVMSDLVDLAALSLLPCWCRRHVAERLRSGQSPSDVLAAAVDHLGPDPRREGAE